VEMVSSRQERIEQAISDWKSAAGVASRRQRRIHSARMINTTHESDESGCDTNDREIFRGVVILGLTRERVTAFSPAMALPDLFGDLRASARHGAAFRMAGDLGQDE